MNVVTFSHGIAGLAVGAQLLTIVVLLALFFRQSRFTASVARHAFPGIFVVSLGSIVVTLVYSLVFDFPPCDLCWWQRVFMYPIPLLVAVAFAKNELHRIGDYILALSIPGALFALYHHYVQVVGESTPFCFPGTSDCGQRLIFEFGYVTLPLMAFTLFALIIVLVVVHKQIRKGISH
jgi:disulfide bond formation protein DsbB